jgi:hypothetical protein
MKARRFDKKLVLNKESIAQLTNGELDAANGGMDMTWTCTCPITGVPCLVCKQS